MTTVEAHAALAHITAPAERAKVDGLEALMERIEAAPKASRVATMAAVARTEGVPLGTLRRKFYAWCKGGAGALQDLRKSRAVPGNAWAECYMGYVEDDKNTASNAWRVMMADFRSGEVLQGVGTWRDCWARERPNVAVPEACPEDFIPRGVKYQNLQRVVKQNPDYLFNLAASRQGRRASHEFLLPVLTTRAGLPVGAVTQYDDVWHNLDVRNQGGVVQPLEFAGYDVASGFKRSSVMKPRDRDAGGKRNNLTEQQFRFLLGYDCCVEGFHPSGFKAVLEHGTTAIREPVERQIKAIPGFGKLITLARSGILSEAVHAGLFAGCGGGNFRMKALCESMHNVLHNRTAHLPGNRGRDAERMHESRGALVRYEERLMAAVEKFDARTRDAIRFELATWSEYVAAFRMIEHELMGDWRHKLEGWEGREVTEFRFSETSNDWQPLESLLADGERAEAVAAWLKGNPGCVRVRPLSRREVWTAGKKELKQVPLMEMPAFLADGDAIELKVRDNGTIGFSNLLYYGRDEVIYRIDKLRTPAGFSMRVAPRQNVWVKFNPLVPDWVWLLDKDSGATLGMAPILNRAPTYDRHAVEVAMGAQAADLARKLLPIRGRRQDAAEGRVARVAHNARVFNRATAATAAEQSRQAQEAASEQNDMVASLADEYAEEDEFFN